MRESFIFYKSFYDSIKELPPENRLEIYEAIYEKEFYSNEIELKGISKSIYTLIIPQLEANDKRYLNGKKGGRPKTKQNLTITKTKPNNNQNKTKTKPNDNVNVNVNDNENVNVNDIYIVEQILDYLNKKTNKHFKKSSNKTKSLIKARLNEGYELEDFKKVIDIKTDEWLEDNIMNAYLRPETLFSNKFEGYLNQKENMFSKWFNEETKSEELNNEEYEEMRKIVDYYR